MRRRIPLSFVVLVLAVPSARPQTSPQPTKDDKPIVVPFELLATKHMAVKVKLNGKGPYRVIFDTGAPMTVLNSKTAKDAGLLAAGSKPMPGLFGATGGPVKAKTFEIGNLKATDMPLMVMDHPTVAELARALGPIEGIVGFPFFARYKMTMDYKAKTLGFVPNGFDPPDVFQSMMDVVNRLMPQGGGKKTPATVLSPAAQWGFVAAKDKDDEEDGVVVKEVLPGGAAAVAGLKAGDRLLTLDDRWTDSVLDLFLAAGAVKPGDAVKAVVRRDKKDVTLTVKPTNGI